MASLIALLIFISCYLLFVFLPAKRTIVAVLGALILLVSGTILPAEAFWAINWNVMGLFVGMLFVADVFMASKVPAYLAEVIVDRAKNTAWAILLICLMTGFISAFVENVATVLIIAPIALSMAKKLKLNPVKMMIAIAISSNLQGAATLIGDPPSMLLGGFMGMNFLDFFFYQGRPSIFWAVELGAVVSFLVLFLVFKNERGKANLAMEEKIKSWFPTILLVVLVMLLASSSLYDQGFPYTAGSLCMLFGLVALVWDKFFNKKSFFSNLSSLDWETTIFLAGVFVLVGSLALTGWIDLISGYLAGVVGSNAALGFILIVLVSVILSAFIDNVPYLAAMLPVASSVALKAGINPSLLLFGLLIGASLGGNITPIGASANIVACSLLKKEGYKVSFGEFFKIGFPFTVSAVAAAAIFLWFVWK